jgi:hypothetical protein
MTARRFAMSATAPAGSVNRKNGAEAAVAIRESASDEAPRLCINHVAARSWAETNVPETTVASQRRQNIGFRSANQVDVDFVLGVFAYPRRKGQFRSHREAGFGSDPDFSQFPEGFRPLDGPLAVYGTRSVRLECLYLATFKDDETRFPALRRCIPSFHGTITVVIFIFD